MEAARGERRALGWAAIAAVVVIVWIVTPVGVGILLGTLLAFVIVCAGVWVLRVRRPDLHRPFKTPFVPLVPILGIVSSLILMIFLPLSTWIRLVIWLIIGMAIYLTYGRKHSKVQQYLAMNDKLSPAKR